ncbi:hypothetical protein [Saccharolobus islandicus]|uniref:hypothetical protein n=1 Tax=Saccharolobus islandicus TaxID=43080 RepID=UPI001F493156|nr:hypothetical protein [Sulfolobus islandicus]
MPLQLNTNTVTLKCSWCGTIIKENPIVVKTCCNNKPWVFVVIGVINNGWRIG